MPTIKKNHAMWTRYEWPEQGDEWSVAWGVVEMHWHGSILPRLAAFVPCDHILEIAAGFGRFTQFLKEKCNRLTVVDLAPRCIDACRQRFADSTHIAYHVNDGKSLAMIADRSVDLAFSYDSLVHAEAEVIRAYLGELARVLRPDGVAFLHHSNIGALIDPETGKLPFVDPHMRAQSVTAWLVAEWAEAAGLACVSQELINWGSEHLVDGFSLLTPQGSTLARPNLVVENSSFMEEATRLAALCPLYVPCCFDGAYLANQATPPPTQGLHASFLRRAFCKVRRLVSG